MDEYIKREDVLQTLKKANIGGYITERLFEIPSAIEELICAMQKEIKEIKERYSYSDSEVTAYLQGQRDMAVDLMNVYKERNET